jgi:hypothetical protein
MITTYSVIRPGHASETHSIDWPKEPGFDRISALVRPLLDGAELERVAVLHHQRRTDMFVDETGALRGLPRNDEATEIYRANWLQQHPHTDPEALPAIYGTAILFDRPVWF